MSKVVFKKMVLCFLILASATMLSFHNANAVAKISNTKLVKQIEASESMINKLIHTLIKGKRVGNLDRTYPPTAFNTPDKISKYLMKNWSQKEAQRLSKCLLKTYKGKYVAIMGDLWSYDYSKAKVLKRTDTRNRTEVTLSNVEANGEMNEELYVLVYEKNKWVLSASALTKFIK